MTISVVIPNFNGEATLPKILAALKSQSHRPDEVIVVDDGSTDGSLRQLQEFPEVKLIKQANQGAPVARNRGVKEAAGEVVIFLDNDIIPTPQFIAEHAKLQAEASLKLVVVGKTIWDPAIKITPFMRWLEDGAQFDYRRMERGQVDFQSFYTSNLSIKRQFILDHHFDEEFKLPGATAFEDTELGYRLQEQGMVIRYNPFALAYHHEVKDFDLVARRRFNEGRVSRMLYDKHPEIAGYFKDSLKSMIAPFILSPLGGILVWLARWGQDKINLGPIFWLALLRSYEEGKRAAH